MSDRGQLSEPRIDPVKELLVALALIHGGPRLAAKLRERIG